MSAPCLRREEGGVRSPGTGVKDWCELSFACWEVNLCLFTAKPSLQLPNHLILIDKETGGKGKPCDLSKAGNYLIMEPGLEPRVSAYCPVRRSLH